jgi:hypothetical protein
MKLKLARRGIAHALVIVAVLIFVCGCADQTVNQSAVRGASVTDTGGEVKTYKVKVHYLNLGSSFTEVQHTVIGTITRRVFESMTSGAV